MPQPSRACLSWVTCSLLLSGCNAADKVVDAAAKKAAAGATETIVMPEAPPAIDSKDPHAAFMTAERPGIPAAYRDINFGMSREQVAKTHPEMRDDVIRLADHHDVFFHLDFGRGDEHLERLYFSMPDERAHRLCQVAWGPGVAMSKDEHGPLRWFNTAEGLRATLSPGFGDEWDIELTAYMPFEWLLGTHGRRFAFVSGEGLLDKTREQLRLEYGLDFVEVDAAAAAAAHRDAGLAGDTKATAHSYLHLPPTEWSELETRVRLHFNDADTVDSYTISLVYEPHPAARGAMFDFFEKKLGHPEESSDLLGDHVWRFPGEPAVELKDDDIVGAWDVHVSH